MRKHYATPVTETVKLGIWGRLMKYTGPESLPAHAAPERKPGKLDGNAPVF